jgi:hypothetical protein
MSSDAMAATPSPAPAYPVRFDVQHPEKSSRLLNNIPYLKLILAIPHIIILYILFFLVAVVGFIAWWAILFTGKYPRGMFNFAVNIQRWINNVNIYEVMMRDEYPPVSGEAGKYPPVTYEVDYPERLSRLLNNIPYLKFILLIPHFIVLILLLIVWLVVYFIAWWAILFTGTYPRGMFDFSVGVFRWSSRISAYAAMMTDAYPPFSMK